MTENLSLGSEIRQPVLSGRAWLSGLWLPADRYGESERRLRILANWHAGAAAYRFPEGDLLRYAAPMEQDCERLPGWPLQKLGRTLCSARIAADEYEKLPAADLWLVRGGKVQALRLADAEVLKPGEWLDVSAPAIHAMYDCRIAEAAQEQPLAPTTQGIRQLLGERIPAASHEQKQFLSALQAGRATPSAATAKAPAWRKPLIALAVLGACLALGAFIASSGGDGGPSSTGSGPSSGGAHFFPWLMLIALAVRSWQNRQESAPRKTSVPSQPSSPKQAGGTRKTSKPGAIAQALIPARRSVERVLPQAWRDWLARAAMTSHLSGILGRRQAAYMRQMLEMFENGRLQDALRHAIPLGGEGGSAGQAFGLPHARRDLKLGMRNDAAGPSIDLGEDLNRHLRQLYRKTFEKLDREGNVEQAVFVLAELLQSHAEAIHYLEKHERYSQAAELALLWDMEASLIVRLMCQAGDLPRAMAVARRDGAFAEAIALLESRWPVAARQLREEWAQALVDQGRWLDAAQAIWPIESMRERATEWLLRAEEAGGSLAAEAVVKRARLLPDSLDSQEARILAIRDDDARGTERAAIAHALLALDSHNDETRLLARALFNAWLVDQDKGMGRLGTQQLQGLLDIAQDPLLRADLPGKLPSPKPNPFADKKEVSWISVPAAAGQAVSDIALLPDLRLLVAQGEAGVTLRDDRGKVLHRFSAPADNIVLADSGQVALAAIHRGEMLCVQRLDLVTREQRDLGAIAVDCYAASFDGVGWTVGQGDAIRILDTGHGLGRVLWQIDKLPGRAVRILRSPSCEQYELADPDNKMLLWQYSLPGRRLASRGHVPALEKNTEVSVIPSRWGGYRYFWMAWDEKNGPWLVSQRPGKEKEHGLALPPQMSGAAINVTLGRAGLAVSLRQESDGCVVLARDGESYPDIAFSWPAGVFVWTKMYGDCWLMFDRFGRVAIMDMERCYASMLTIA
ncbi:bpX6 domain-containing protein [Chromobacterium violaceum]|uniref:bpX6 domain-containing protein n=1 Tax=Chromobacterium violaceum TaxID=536 RepID=UPI00068F2050|nr:bpX6 domain-containing protein [Chromobacterium violaceum]